MHHNSSLLSIKVFSKQIMMCSWWLYFLCNTDGTNMAEAVPLSIICNSKQILWSRMFSELCNDTFFSVQKQSIIMRKKRMTFQCLMQWKLCSIKTIWKVRHDMRRAGKPKILLLFIGIMPSLMNRYFIVFCHHLHKINDNIFYSFLYNTS